MLAFGRPTIPAAITANKYEYIKRRGPGHAIHFKILHPLNLSGVAEDRIVKLCARVDAISISLVMMTNCPPGERG